MPISSTGTFQKILVQLRAFETHGLRFKITVEGESFSSVLPVDEKLPSKRSYIPRSVCISDLVRDQIQDMQVGDVLTLAIPDELKNEISEKSWNSTLTSLTARVFGAGNFTSHKTSKGLELMRLA